MKTNIGKGAVLLSLTLTVVMGTSGTAAHAIDPKPGLEPIIRIDPNNPPRGPVSPDQPAPEFRTQGGASGPFSIFGDDPNIGHNTPIRTASSSEQICYNSWNYNTAYSYHMHLNMAPPVWTSPTYYGDKTQTCSPWKFKAGQFTGLLATHGYADVRSDVWLYWN